MVEAFNNLYSWLSEQVGGPANSNLVLMGFVALGCAWILLRAVRTGAAIGAAARGVERERGDHTMLIALRKAEARIMQLEQELAAREESPERAVRLVGSDGVDPRRGRFLDAA